MLIKFQAAGCGVLSVCSWNSQMQPHLRNSHLVWDPISAAQTQTRLFLQRRDIKTESAAQSMRTINIYIWNGFHSLSAFKEQPCVTTACACVGVWGMMSVGCGSVILQVAHRGLATARIPQDMCTCRRDFNLTKTPQVHGSLFAWQLKWFEGNAITNCWFRGDRSGKSRDYYGSSIHIFVWGHHTFHTSSVWNMIALLFKAQNGLCRIDFIIEQCSRPWQAIRLRAGSFIYFKKWCRHGNGVCRRVCRRLISRISADNT